ncbi:hypothetical protein ACEWY4_008900 [Coilia grayii]|uniref:E3 ubiquitin-protein ligase n=1 Tax=Coilia grayii TaxID=363190 RepID=A0ABD1K4W4_9TELE
MAAPFLLHLTFLSPASIPHTAVFLSSVPQQCTQLGYVRSQRRCPDVVNTDQREASELPACTCPCSSSCRWQGILGDVVPHLIQAHRLITHREGKEVVFPLSNSSAAADAVDRVMLQSCFGRAFVLVVKKQPVVAGGPASFFATVLFVGASEEAEGFVYRLELRGDRRRLMWEATPRAIQGSLATGPTDSDCMMFEPSVASLFTASGTLGLHVSIYRSCSTTDPSPHTQELPPHRQLTGRANPASLTQGSPYLETMPSAQL